jgi:hypothetical protein
MMHWTTKSLEGCDVTRRAGTSSGESRAFTRSVAGRSSRSTVTERWATKPAGSRGRSSQRSTQGGPEVVDQDGRRQRPPMDEKTRAGFEQLRRELS